MVEARQTRVYVRVRACVAAAWPKGPSGDAKTLQGVRLGFYKEVRRHASRPANMSFFDIYLLVC